MSTGRIRWLAVLLLCLYGAALVHQVSPHRHTGDQAATCGLCALVFATVLAACATVLAIFTRPVARCRQLSPSSHAVYLWRSPCLRGPPRLV
ncbi:MAG TPA: hypothetical protein VMZ06_02505 [Candidatus Bathyarchaeia archaeon]|nr:hypothetical protein [Candidatus Bathyarchaeia archaeon]